MSKSSVLTIALFSSLDKFWMLSGLKSVGASQHHAEGVCHFSPHILSMSRRASWLSHRLLSSSHCAALSSSCRTSWLSHRLLPSSRCATLLSSRRAILLSHHLSSSSRRAGWLSHRLSSSSHRASWLLCCLSMRRPLVVSSSCRVASRHLVEPAGCRIIISRCPLVAPPSHPLIVLAGCCVASPSPPSHPLVIFHRQCHRTPSNAAAAIERHRHPRH